VAGEARGKLAEERLEDGRRRRQARQVGVVQWPKAMVDDRRVHENKGIFFRLWSTDDAEGEASDVRQALAVPDAWQRERQRMQDSKQALLPRPLGEILALGKRPRNIQVNLGVAK
jgi:hypothetical protein